MAEITTPVPLGVAKVVYRVMSASGDTDNDIDDLPDLAGISGSWKLTPVVNRVLVTTAQNPYTLVPLPINGSFINGSLEYNSQSYVKIPTSPRGPQDRPYFLWRFEATYRISPTASVSDSFMFDARPTDADGKLDLTLERPVDTVAGAVPVTRGPRGFGVTGSLVRNNSLILLIESDSGVIESAPLPMSTGPKGDPGLPGIQGPKGDTGAAGTQGIQGAKGDTGAAGTTGPKGDTGAAGTTGAKGDTGSQGPVGPKGDTGAKGDTGNGLQVDGQVATYSALPTTGTDGINYLTLDTGKLYRRSGGAWPTEANGVALRGPKGDTGATGAAGTQGAKGDTGAAGAAGSAGAKGDTGAQGIQGPKGDTGLQGPKGDTGTAGTAGAAGATGPAGTTTWAGITDKPNFDSAYAQASVPLRSLYSARNGGNVPVPGTFTAVKVSSDAPAAFANPTAFAVADLPKYATFLGGPARTVYSDSFWINDLGKVEAPGTITLSFWTDNQHFVLEGVSYGVGDVKVYADDIPYASTAIVHTIAYQSAVRVEVAMPTKRMRRYEITVGTAALTRLIGEKNCTFTPASAPRARATIIGDSWMAGSQKAAGTVSGNAMPEYFRLASGLDVAVVAQGGTGYDRPGDTGSGFEAFGGTVRMAGVVRSDPDVVIVAGSINDNAATATTIQAAATALFSKLATQLPGVPVIVVGAQPVALAEPLYDKCNTAVLAAAAAAPNVIGVIDWRGDKWMTGTGKVGSPVGDGNADYYLSADGLHPEQVGDDYFGHRLATAVGKIRAVLKPRAKGVGSGPGTGVSLGTLTEAVANRVRKVNGVTPDADGNVTVAGGTGGNDSRLKVMSTTIGDGATLGPYNITHNFGTRAVVTSLRQKQAPYKEIRLVDIAHPSINALQILTDKALPVTEVDLLGIMGTTDVTLPSRATVTYVSKTVNSATLSATATDDVAVLGFNWFQDGVYVGTSYGAANFTATGLVSGTAYAFTATAVDTSGNESAQASVAVSVTTTAAPADVAYVGGTQARTVGAAGGTAAAPYTVGTGANRVLLAFVAIGHAAWQNAAGITASCVSSVDGAMTLVGVLDAAPAGQETGQVWVYQKLNPTAGAHTITATGAKSGMANGHLMLEILEYTGVSAVSNFTSSAYNSGTMGANTLTVPSAVGNMAVIAFGNAGNGVASVSGKTPRLVAAGADVDGTVDQISVYDVPGAATSVTLTSSSVNYAAQSVGVNLVKAA